MHDERVLLAFALLNVTECPLIKATFPREGTGVI